MGQLIADYVSLVCVVELCRSGGCCLYSTFTSGVEKFGKPRRARFILEKDELLQLFDGWHVLKHGESTLEDGRPTQFIAAFKPN